MSSRRIFSSDSGRNNTVYYFFFHNVPHIFHPPFLCSLSSSLSIFITSITLLEFLGNVTRKVLIPMNFGSLVLTVGSILVHFMNDYEPRKEITDEMTSNKQKWKKACYVDQKHNKDDNDSRL